jgi:hypothetical protein
MPVARPAPPAGSTANEIRFELEGGSAPTAKEGEDSQDGDQEQKRVNRDAPDEGKDQQDCNKC